jgi:hypothetical protein
VVTTRRALVAAGAGVLLAGCGREERAGPTEADVLSRALAFELALAGAFDRIPGVVVSGHGEQIARLEAALRAAGGAGRPEPADVPRGEPGTAALELVRGAMAAYVDAVGRTPDAGRRAAIARLLTDAAGREAALLMATGRDPLASAFADGRDA